jgi:hypothetical protein
MDEQTIWQIANYMQELATQDKEARLLRDKMIEFGNLLRAKETPSQEMIASVYGYLVGTMTVLGIIVPQSEHEGWLRHVTAAILTLNIPE